MLTIKIKEGNSAFDEYPNEHRRILSEVANQIEAGRTEGAVNDMNGNKVCIWKRD